VLSSLIGIIPIGTPLATQKTFPSVSMTFMDNVSYDVIGYRECFFVDRLLDNWNKRIIN
jgi:hypothetical protein